MVLEVNSLMRDFPFRLMSRGHRSAPGSLVGSIYIDASRGGECTCFVGHDLAVDSSILWRLCSSLRHSRSLRRTCSYRVRVRRTWLRSEISQSQAKHQTCEREEGAK